MTHLISALVFVPYEESLKELLVLMKATTLSFNMYYILYSYIYYVYSPADLMRYIFMLSFVVLISNWHRMQLMLLSH